jgi:membrane-bound lytic murein transglycosylase D
MLMKKVIFIFFCSIAFQAQAEEKTILQSAISQEMLFHPQISDAILESALNDEELRMKPNFKIPEEIKDTTRFWLKIYTKYTTRDIVFFDQKNMNETYEVLNFEPILSKSRNKIVYEILTERLLKKTRAEYLAAFNGLIRTPHPTHPTPKQKIILSHAPSPSSAVFREMKEHFKYLRGQRDNLISGLIAAESFLPKMEMIFAEADVPTEYTRLSLVESSFNLKATSKVGASGVWQFMPSIGKKYLTINHSLNVDERRSPLKSTVAAAKMLKWSHKYLGSWVLAVIAYNHGLKHLPRFHHQEAAFEKIAYLFNPDHPKNALGWASRSYYCEFLAALYAENYRHLFFGEIPNSGISPITYLQLPKPESGLQIAQQNHIKIQDFKFLNADVQNLKRKLPQGFWIALPRFSDDIRKFTRVQLAKKMRLVRSKKL